jgi:multidrug efflux pump subunit AcrB
VLAALPGLRLLPGERVVVLSNQSTFIESAIAEVQENTLLGGVLAVLVLLFFLRDLRATAVIAVSIPISLLATFMPLQLLGVSLNLMSLGGLALGVGMLVDNSIVVLESIARVRERARDPQETGDPVSRAATAVRGTVEVAASVVASTLTTVAVFLPMAFVEGVAGRLVRDLSYTVSFSILSSMVVSLTLVPVLQSLGEAASEPAGPPPRSLLAWLVVVPALLLWPARLLVRGLGKLLALLAAPLTLAYAGLERLYPRLLRLALRARVLVLRRRARAVRRRPAPGPGPRPDPAPGAAAGRILRAARRCPRAARSRAAPSWRRPWPTRRPAIRGSPRSSRGSAA